MRYKDIQQKLKEIEVTNNVQVLYCTVSGSKLYGTDNPGSDLDVKFIFKPTREDVLLKRDKEHIKIGAQTKEKNTKDDIDFDGYSIYKFLNLLKKSETGAIDILFSMWRTDTIIYEDFDFTDTIKSNYKSFLNSNMKAFIGYALGQSKKFGIKGARYNELDDFVKFLEEKTQNTTGVKLEKYFDIFHDYINGTDSKYIKIVTAPGPRGSGEYKDIEYLSVLGKLFAGSNTFEYALERINLLYKQFGNRTKTIASTTSKTDFKALSHALRIALEVKELLETEFIKFPLKDRELLKDIKAGKTDITWTIDQIEETLSIVDTILERSEFPLESDNVLMDKILLDCIEYDEN